MTMMMACACKTCKCKWSLGWSCLVVTLGTFVSLLFSLCVLDRWMVNQHTTTDEPFLKISEDGHHHHTSRYKGSSM